MKYCNEGGNAHTYDENGLCFECNKVDRSLREMRYRAAQAKRGLKMVRVWVPGTDTD